MGCCESTHAVATQNTIAKKPSNVEKVFENVSNDQENGNPVVMEQKEEVLNNEETNFVENETGLDNVSVNEDLKEGDDNKDDARPVQETGTETQCESLEVAPVEKGEPVKENKEEEIAIVQPTEPEVATFENENIVAVPSPESKETLAQENIEENAEVVPSADSEEATIEIYEENAAEETINEIKNDVSAPEPEEAIDEKEDETVEIVQSPVPEETEQEKGEENAPIVSSPEPEEINKAEAPIMSSPEPEETKVEATIVLEPETTINENEAEPEASETVESISKQENTPATNQESVVASAAKEAKTD